MLVKNKINSILGDLLVTLLLGSLYINVLLCSLLNSSTGFVKYIFMLEGLLLILYFCSNLIKGAIKINVNMFRMFVSFTILAGFLITLAFSKEQTSITVLEFACRCFLPLVIGIYVKVDGRNVLKYLMIVLMLGYPFINSIFTKANTGSYDAVTMGTSYALLPVILAPISHLFFFGKKSTLFEKILYVSSIPFVLLFVIKSYRGALFSLLLFVVVLILIKYVRGKMYKRAIAYTTVIVLTVIVYIFSDHLLLSIANFLSTYNIRIASLDKLIILSSNNDILHGRLEVWKEAILGISEKPLLGHGYSTFSFYTNYPFPHNIFLQLFFDCGIFVGGFLSITFIVLIFKRWRFLEKTTSHIFPLFLVLFFASVPRAMVSAESWLLIIFWFLFGFLFNGLCYDYQKKALSNRVIFPAIDRKNGANVLS